MLIDRLGRKPLLSIGVAGMTICLFLLSYGFNSASYTLPVDSITGLVENVDLSGLEGIAGKMYESDIAFNEALASSIDAEVLSAHKSEIIKAAIQMNPKLILVGILGFVASFAISIGPVMWVLFSELFPNRIRGIAISFVGVINSAVSFVVQWVFPWQLETLGNAGTFFIYGVFALLRPHLYRPSDSGNQREVVRGVGRRTWLKPLKADASDRYYYLNARTSSGARSVHRLPWH